MTPLEFLNVEFENVSLALRETLRHDYPGLRVAQIAFATVEGSADRKGPPQFKMSFEPKQCRIADKDDFPFIPDAA